MSLRHPVLRDVYCVRGLIGSPKLQIIFHKRATKYRSLLRKMTFKDKGSYESWPPCTARCVLCARTNVKTVLMFVRGVSVSVMSLFQHHTHTCDMSLPRTYSLSLTYTPLEYDGRVCCTAGGSLSMTHTHVICLCRTLTLSHTHSLAYSLSMNTPCEYDGRVTTGPLFLRGRGWEKAKLALIFVFYTLLACGSTWFDWCGVY